MFGMTVDPGELWEKAFPAPSFGHGKVWPVHCLFQCLHIHYTDEYGGLLSHMALEH